jgi:aminopeptidase N
MLMPAPRPRFLKDYAPPACVVTHVDMVVNLHATATLVETILHVTHKGKGPLVLDGEGLELISLTMDGEPHVARFNEGVLTLTDLPARAFTLAITQRCSPQANTELSGLYLSNGVFCTQMEAEGFRRFAFMQDRPDVMATYMVRLEAPESFPVLLSNGNCTKTGKTSDGHFAVWEDPHPKPTYLFALVAGDLASVHDSFVTSDAREVALGIYVERGKEDRCAWAMQCLKASMRWDEERFGRVYDLDVFNIVAVSDFNMGAMENKGLNIFNDKFILARKDTATDTDHVNIERIIAHEYFHNWTGNRITCRDWFQLCLKEGLTVFRDQEFTADLRSRAVKRIEDVKTLRARQFPEDQGPLAHPVRPQSYIEINNFYTPTVYEKGAEICRMLLTLVGTNTFRKAMDLYFQRHDGEAATVEDFLGCFAEASGRDLSQFARWYDVAGTPVVSVTTSYDPQDQEYTINLLQHTPDSPGQTNKPPLHLPLRLGLLDADGKDVPLLTKENIAIQNGLFEFTSESAQLTFRHISKRPVLSINRGFSVPILLKTDATEADLLFQMAHDTDSFNRWEAAQTMARHLFVLAYKHETVNVSAFTEGLALTLRNNTLDDAFKSLMLLMPSEAEVTAALARDVDATRVHNSRRRVLHDIALHLVNPLKVVISATRDTPPYRPDTASAARRSLRLSALHLLSYAVPHDAIAIGRGDVAASTNMTVEAGTLASLSHVDDAAIDDMLLAFYDRHADDHLLVDKWFLLSAARPAPNAAARIAELTRHPAFTYKTPNRVYALLGGFTGGNPAGFHAADGSGYALLANAIITLHSLNPQVASRMATSFRSFAQYDAPRSKEARAEMNRILAEPGLARDVYEIISRTLA